MLTNSIIPIKGRALPIPESDATLRRVSHGSTRFAADPRMRQPQDGAIEIPSRIATITSKLHPALPMEPEDARMTGMTRSLFRRVMGLNVMTVPEPTAPTGIARNGRKPQGRPRGSAVRGQVQVA